VLNDLRENMPQKHYCEAAGVNAGGDGSGECRRIRLESGK